MRTDAEFLSRMLDFPFTKWQGMGQGFLLCFLRNGLSIILVIFHALEIASGSLSLPKQFISKLLACSALRKDKSACNLLSHRTVRGCTKRLATGHEAGAGGAQSVVRPAPDFSSDHGLGGGWSPRLALRSVPSASGAPPPAVCTLSLK